jgi:hypothetical protein
MARYCTKSLLIVRQDSQLFAFHRGFCCKCCCLWRHFLNLANDLIHSILTQLTSITSSEWLPTKNVAMYVVERSMNSEK